MASLATTPPEVLHEILKDLRRKDILSLLRTSKSLYPTCYHYLWTTLIFTDHKSWSEDPCFGADLYLPNNRIRSDHITFKGLLGLIRAGAPFGLDITRVLWLGRSMFDRYGGLRSVSWDFRRHLADLLDQGEVGLREVGVHYCHEALSATEKPINSRDRDCLMPLPSLRKFTESKTIRDFSLIVDATTIRTFSTYFKPELITHFQLCVSFQEAYKWDRYSCTFTDRYGPLTKNIVEFTGLIRGMVNIRRFVWKMVSCNIPKEPQYESLQELEGLQGVFMELKQLRELNIYGPVFHSSFFLVPPETVKKLLIGGIMSAEWWMKFAKCPLEGVEELTLAKSQQDEQNGDEGRNLQKPIVLGDVACRGLTKLLIEEEDNVVPHSGHTSNRIPVDIGSCILNRNPGIGKPSSREIALKAANNLLATSEPWLRLISRQSAATLRYLVPERFLRADGPRGISVATDIDQDFLELFLTDHHAGLSREYLQSCCAQWRDFSGIETSQISTRPDGLPEYRLRLALVDAIEMVLDLYVYKYGLTPPAGKQKAFIEDCMETLQGPNVGEWLTRKREVQSVLRLCEERIEDEIDRQRDEMREKFAGRILNGDTFGLEDVRSEWRVLLGERFGRIGGDLRGT
ncbi:hypothetical protein TWF481_009202 [Arthrobotrys musiformis]|uniref:F-box domain-containing protein n=1 Tax=Arthrobotrys musiformis TaxID=47236 RepID=A0AAV9W312_9PEZI